jgi:hypothetical protein
MTPDDFPRLQANAQLPFWKTKLDSYRAELAGLEQLSMQGPTGAMGMTGYSSITLDFHKGVNTLALKAAMCHAVDQDEHTGKLIASFLEEVVSYYHTKSPIWRDLMAGLKKGTWTGEYWGGLAENHIIDPMIWYSTAHLYDMIYGKGYLSEQNAKDFETMMGLFHQLCCLHEEMQKMDNNRAAWLNGGSFLSALFDENPIRAKVTMDKCVANMPRLVSTILDDGCHYEIGPYCEASVTAIHYAARIIRNVQGTDFFKAGDYGPGFEAAFNGWVNRLIPGSSLRLLTMRDRIDHWDTACFGYLEYNIPQVGWALNRMHERTWVPMFKHWPQGAEFYAYREPDNAKAPTFLDSHFDHAGMAILRSSWKSDACSMYFRYGFQGSSHGGGLDKLNFELTCNDEPILCDPLISERSHDKNVVIVDGHTQQQCTGKCLYADVENDGRLQVISALSGLGKFPDRPVFHDPRSEVGYWCTQYDECFPGIARQRRTMMFIDRRYWIIRDTLWSQDEKPHEYQWIFHSFGSPQGIGQMQCRHEHTYDIKRLYWSERPIPETRLTNRHTLLKPGQFGFASDKAQADLFMLGVNMDVPTSLDLWQGAAKHHYNGSPDRGDGLAAAPFVGSCFSATGKDVALVTVIDARPSGTPATIKAIHSLATDGLEGQLLQIQTNNGTDVIQINESDQPCILNGKTINPGYSIA